MASRGAWFGKPCANPECGGKKGKNYAANKFCGNCSRKAAQSNRDAAWAARILRTYGITAEQYWQLYEFQGGLCALCRRANGKSKRLAIDHDHATGEVRGLLCGTCNKIVGHARDEVAFFVRGQCYLLDPPWRVFAAGGTPECPIHQEAA